jgi:RNA polymerase sigma-70 factor (ECF subfamily)
MPEFPETRESLLTRVKDPRDSDAWSRFVAVYRPVIYRLARGRGLQDADAQDVTQQVLASVAQAIARWEPDPAKGRFRSWLSRIVRNAALNALTRKPPDISLGSADVVQRIDSQSKSTDVLRREFEHEYQRAVFRWAQDRVRPEFQDSTWAAFWQTTVEGQSVDRVVRQLGKSRGAVYAARSRVMRRLKEAVREFEDQDDSVL